MGLLTRRALIRTGIGGVALLAVASGCAPHGGTAPPPFNDPKYDYIELSADDRALIAAVGRAMLDGALPQEPAAYEKALVQVVRGVDVAVRGLVPGVQGEVHQLFGLLNFPVTRALAGGIWSSWGDASTADVAAFLTRWRYSGVMLFRTGYQALHQLVMASWYGNSASWARIGYPGPPAVG